MKYFLIAGEASGDMHAAKLMKEIRGRDRKAEFCFLGGDLMAEQGGKLVRHYRDMAFMGFAAVVKNLGKVRQNYLSACKAILEFSPDVVILVDYPEFNLKIASFVKRNTKSRVFYYIAPKLWVWRAYRIRTIQKYVDKMFTIFPFENQFFAKRGYAVNYVGNPSLDTIEEVLPEFSSRHDFQRDYELENLPVIAILPGSRMDEIKACLPRMLEAAATFTSYQTVIAMAPGIDEAVYQEITASLEVSENVKLIRSATHELLYHSRLAIVNSGTATLETALLNIPQVVVYHFGLGKLALKLKDLFLKTKWVSLVNILAGEELVRELLAHEFTTDNLVAELKILIMDEEYISRMQDGYSRIRELLGAPGASQRCADSILKELLVPKG